MEVLSPLVSNSELNLSNQSKYLLPGVNNLRQFSPFNTKISPKTPNLSPIKPKTPASESTFLKRRDGKNIKAKLHEKYRRRSEIPTRIKSPINPVLDQTISVKSTLRALKLDHLEALFNKEEVNTMIIFLTLSNADLELIGVNDAVERRKILDFIASFKTPQKFNTHRYRS